MDFRGCLWPSFGLLVSVPMKETVLIGLFCGTRKSDSAKEDFVSELQNLEQVLIWMVKS